MNLKAQSNSKSGHKNITYDSIRHHYIVSIRRNGKLFVARADALEEAICIRDRALKFYEEHSCLPKKSDLGISRRKNRKFKERVKKIRPVYTCEMCKKEMSYKSDQMIEDFKKRGNLCGHCLPEDRSNLSLDSISGKIGRLNEKYVVDVVTKYGKRYYSVKFGDRRHLISGTFTSLEDAIVFRDQIINFYKEQNRLPNNEELVVIFGARSYSRKHSDRSSTSENSSTGLKNIVYHTKTDRYYVSIIRDRVKTSISFKTLEDAKLARQIILDTYEETGVMLRSGEVRARMRELGKLS